MTARSPRLELPAVPAPFPPGFVAVLHQVVSLPAEVFGAVEHRHRARAAALSQSGTFVGHRPYVRGDDPRRIDWAACARSGGLFVKQLEQDERRSTALLLDLSPRLSCGEPPRRLGMLRAAAVLGGLALQHLDGLSVLAPGAGAQAVRAFAGKGALPALLQHLQSLPMVATEARAIAGLPWQHLPARLWWLSDFADPAAMAAPLRALRRRGVVVAGCLPMLASDRDPGIAGYVRVVDPDSGEAETVPVDAALAAELRRQLAALATRQDRLFAEAGARLLRWPQPAAEDFSLAAYAPLAAHQRR
jgi:uncharacterized protein (DUF58 family)